MASLIQPKSPPQADALTNSAIRSRSRFPLSCDPRAGPVPFGGRFDTDFLLTTQEHDMYDMYPDWGPAKHHRDDPRNQEALQASLDLRDNGGQRPDDN